MLCATTASAQYLAGLKAGYGQGAFTGTSEFQWQPGASTYAAFVNGAVTPTISLQIEAVISEKLGESRVTGSDLTFQAQYLSIPLMLRYTPPAPGPVRPYVMAGPSLAIQTRCELRFVTTGLVSVNDCKETAGDLRNTDVAMELGAGLQILMGPANLIVEARSTTNVGTVVVPTETRESRGFAWSLMTGFSVPFPRRSGTIAPPGGTRPSPLPQRDEELVQRVSPATPIATAPAAPSGLPLLPAPEVAERVPQATGGNAGQRVSVHAVDADARSVLLGIAREAGLNLTVSNDVNRRVSLNLVDVPALQAIQEVATAAGLTVATPENRALPALVYYQLPVNANSASAETISKRFGVSEELARWIVETRKPK